VNYAGEQVIDPGYAQMAVGVVVTGVVSAALGWVLGTFTKIGKKEHDKDVELLIKRIEKYETEAKEFVTREMMRELRREFHDALADVKSEIKTQGGQIIALLTKDRT